ncbi:MAG: DoxX family protein [Verrucomicrobiota bacterium]
MKTKITSWILQILVAGIIGQTLFFKFSDHPQTVELFAQLGLGAFAYKSIAVAELIACILLLVPRSIAWGAGLSAGIMSGAIFAHLTTLGFSGAEGELGIMAIVAFAFSLVLIYMHRMQLESLSCFVPAALRPREQSMLSIK